MPTDNYGLQLNLQQSEPKSLQMSNLPKFDYGSLGNTNQNPEGAFSRFTSALSEQLPQYAKDTTLTSTIYSKLNDTLRYTDENLGYNPFDGNIEDKYAQAHPVQTFRNNLAQFGAKFVGAAVESIATIPLVISALANRDFSVLNDNPVTNTIHDFTEQLDKTIPVFQSNYERDNPLLKYLNPLKPTSFFGAWGGGLNNLGFTVGAIAGALVEDAAITALTGGLGLVPTVAAQGSNFLTKLGRGARAIAKEPELMNAVARTAYRGEEAAQALLNPSTSRQLEREAASAVVGEGAVSTSTASASNQLMQGSRLGEYGEGIANNAMNVTELRTSDQAINSIQKSIARSANWKKITDGARYNLSLLTSAASEGAFEASQVYHDSRNQMIQDYYNQNGVMPDENTLADIERFSKNSSNITMASNIALLYLSNRLNWGSLFKPTSEAVIGTGIKGWGKNIARTEVKRELAEDGSKFLYNTISKTPESRIGKILLNGEKVGRNIARSLSEGVEEGSQYIVSQSATDYAMRRFDARNRNEVIDYLSSFNKGVSDTLTTNEGWDNIIGGIVGGIIGGGFERLIHRGAPTQLQQYENQANTLNKQTLNGIYQKGSEAATMLDNLYNPTLKSQGGLITKIDEAATQTSLAQEHKQAIDAGDIKLAKDIQNDMAVNYWSNATKNNLYGVRSEELEEARNLEGKSFASYWGMEDNAENREKINKFIDDQLEFGKIIKRNTENITRISKNPFSIKNDPINFRLNEAATDELIRAASRFEMGQYRLTQIMDGLKTSYPSMDINKVVDITSIGGIKDVVNRLHDTINTLSDQIELSAGNPYLRSQLQYKQRKLKEIAEKAKSLIENSKIENGIVTGNAFSGKVFMSTMQDLFDLHNGIDFQNNEFLEQHSTNNEQRGLIVHPTANQHIKDTNNLADLLERLQDARSIAADGINFQRMYNYLNGAGGWEEYITKLKQNAIDSVESMINPDGTLKPVVTKEGVENDIREDEQAKVKLSDELLQDEKEKREDPTKGEPKVDILKRAAKKVVNSQKLTQDEQDAADDFPSEFNQFVAAEEKVKSRVDSIFDDNGNVVKEEPKQNRVIGASNNELFFGLFSNVDFYKNSLIQQYKILFKKGYVKFITDINGELTERPAKEGTEASDTGYVQNGDTKLYRKEFEKVVVIKNGKNIIGEMRPYDSLYYIDENGNYESIVDNDGNLKITKEQFKDFTGRDDYEDFKAEFSTYVENYKKLFVGNKTTVSGDRILKLFKPVFSASTKFNSKREKQNDTLLSKAKPSNYILATFEQGKNGVKATIHTTAEATESQLNQIANYESFINDTLLNGKQSVTIAIFPIAGQIRENSFVRARRVDENLDFTPDNISYASSPEVFQNYDIAFRPVLQKTESEANTTEEISINKNEENTDDAVNEKSISNGDKIINVKNKPLTNELKPVNISLSIEGKTNRIFINPDALKNILVVPNNTLEIQENGNTIIKRELNSENNVIFEAMSGRYFVVANINGTLIPFYKSSAGTSGKNQGEWYPFFGYTGAWLVKGYVNKETGDMQYIPEIDNVRRILNNNLIFPDTYINRVTNTIKNTKGDDVFDFNNYFRVNRLWKNNDNIQTGNKYTIKGLKENTRFESGIVALITGLNTTELDSSEKNTLSEWLKLLTNKILQKNSIENNVKEKEQSVDIEEDGVNEAEKNAERTTQQEQPTDTEEDAVNEAERNAEREQPFDVEEDKIVTQKATDKKSLAKIIKSLFGYSQQQANANAELFDRMAQNVKQRTGEDLYEKIGFGNAELLSQMFKRDVVTEKDVTLQDIKDCM